MSEHRSPALSQGTWGICDWPDCSCAQQWRRWEVIFEDDWDNRTFDCFELACAEVEMRLMLECVSANCLDWRARRHATVQLMHPAFSGGVGE
jgi:hypothetical protein